ncbi:MAG: protein translocase subunit SecD [Gemmatimonadales bacterium]|nr:MAG: protein translocase subunit SecD [Gemmatimonadales bacterium]
MFKSIRVRIVVILAVIGLSGWYLYDNYQEAGTPVKLGLDLQGGMHLVLEVDDPEGIMSLEERSDAIDRAVTVIRNRVDELGVEEPIVQKSGEDRLIVELAGITDEERAKELIGQTALLEWRHVRPTSRAEPALPRIDRAVVAALGADSIRALGRAVDDADQEELEDLLFGDQPPPGALDPLDADTVADADPDTIVDPDDVQDPEVLEQLEELDEDERDLRPFSSLLLSAGADGEFLVSEEDYPLARMFLELPEVQAVIPRQITLRFGWQPFGIEGQVFRQLYVLDRSHFLQGDQLVDANSARSADTNMPIVQFELTRAGGRIFGTETGQNVGNRIAILLDNDVVSAPTVRAQIRARGQIDMGTADMQEARDLALVLRAGALPAPLRIMEERTVGPSLGQDSIDQGIIAGLIGLALVVAIMIAYYKVTGVLAILALSVYVILLMGGLALLGATLTVPGIAGIILSIGMAVDANVLIFERIREEVDQDRAVRTAVDEGFGHALSAIVDANITTLITALILFQFGTGPVRGFAVTLSIGIIASFFTALYVTRTLYLIYIRNKKAQDTISI